jgi:hypothetical protein
MVISMVVAAALLGWMLCYALAVALFYPQAHGSARRRPRRVP